VDSAQSPACQLDLRTDTTSTAGECLRQFEFCQRMFEQAVSRDDKEKWFQLATNWLRLYSDASRFRGRLSA
jgi:hypothetical protein